MKKKLARRICSFFVLSIVLLGAVINASAEDIVRGPFDNSYLTTEESSTGYTYSNDLLKGQHLMDGESGISKAGRGRIYAYGATTANHKVDYIGVIVYVDRFEEELDAWVQIDAWSADDWDTYFISAGKTMNVETGYYYRVHSEHFAGNEVDYPYDSAISYTDGIWI